MYADFFGLRELPFNNTPDPRFFYSTRDHEEALASLIYAVQERKGFVLLTGEVGAGKTLVSRMMLRHFGSRIAFATINHSLSDGADLLESICTEFELPAAPNSSRTQIVRLLHDFLLAKFAQDTPVVLVLDEAQTLPVDAFEQVRMIGNLEADDAKLLQVVMLGQPELQRRFATAALRQLRQRVFRSFHLPALSRDECEGYIHHRLSVAGPASLNVFDEEAIDSIYELSKGLPRIINTLCDNLMLSAYSADQLTVDAQLVRSVADQMMMSSEDRQAGSGFPLQPADAHSMRHEGAGSQEEHAGMTGGYVAPYRRESPSRVSGAPVYEAAPRRMFHTPEQPPIGDYDVASPEVAHAARDETARLIRDAQTHMNHLVHQLSGIEARVSKLTAAQGDANALCARLRQLLDRGESLTQRSAAGIKEVEQREARLAGLAAQARAVITEIARMFDLMKKSAAKNRRAERQAWQTFDRLVAQTESSRRLADRLDDLAGRLMIEENAGLAETGTVVRQAAMPIAAMNDATSKNSNRAITLDHYHHILSAARKSLLDLRSLRKNTCAHDEFESASDERSSSGESSRTLDEPATQRLAEQVEGLLEMVETA